MPSSLPQRTTGKGIQAAIARTDREKAIRDDRRVKERRHREAAYFPAF